MKKAILALLFLFVSNTFCQAQHIESKKIFGGYTYTIDGKKTSLKKLDLTMKSHPEALQIMEKAKSNYSVASLLSGLGGGLIGWPLGAQLAGGDPNWNLALAGAGLIVVSIPIASSAHNKANEAVALYNSSLGSNVTSYELKFVANGNGLGLCLKF